jgi:F-type H+-transporting ATPase subunit epsilon
MAGTLTLRVITPEKIALDRAVTSVRLPGLDGSIGVLPRHAPMVAALDTGLLRYRPADGQAGRDECLFVAGGFAEMRGETLRVVSEAGEKPEEIDEERAQAAEKRARERLAVGRAAPGEPIDLLRAEAALRRSLFRMRARGFRGS